MKVNDTLITTIIGDITKTDDVDAIVNPTSSTMTGIGGLSALYKGHGYRSIVSSRISDYF